MSQHWHANTTVQEIDIETLKAKVWDLFPGLGSREPPNQEHIEILQRALTDKGPDFWNEWRRAHPSIQPNLAGLEFPVLVTESGPAGLLLQNFDFDEANLRGAVFQFSELRSVRLRGATLRESFIMQSRVVDCDFSGADLTQATLGFSNIDSTRFDRADLSRAVLFHAIFDSCRFDEADLQRANLSSATFSSSSFQSSSLGGAFCEGTDFSGSNLQRAALHGTSLVGAKLLGTDISGAYVYGVNAWDVQIDEKTVQESLVLTGKGPTVKVDNIKLAQFVYTLLDTAELRNVINTMTGRAVLILGRFIPERMAVLEAIAQKLRELGDLPIIFNFDRPVDRSTSETISILAGLSKFIIADLTDPKSSPYESRLVVPAIAVPFFPIIEAGQNEFSMFEDLYDYDWLLEGFQYQNVDHLMRNLEAIREEALLKRDELRRRRKHGRQGFRKELKS